MLFEFEHLSENIKNAGTELNSYDDLQADMDRQEFSGGRRLTILNMPMTVAGHHQNGHIVFAYIYIYNSVMGSGIT